MLSWPPTVRIYLAAESTDMQKGFDSLDSRAVSSMVLEPVSGFLFVFRNRRGGRVKALRWDRGGHDLGHKRLENGSFRFPAATWADESKGVEIEAANLMILDGLDLGRVRRQRGRERRPA